jgi:hypothetical protein
MRFVELMDEEELVAALDGRRNIGSHLWVRIRVFS